ncbi:hypothetical protein Sru01_09340 [Sphaerisporangium rufum]|uniref:CBU-0592-like domain-containing protein n=1 Tax=Sphaerisporangium rufum TaxID=1381558 RepID=A0A919R2R9_9ACTN|nr:hypothetical protein [Sphaerisporangium rufum]GII75952.1 hypothetical protein Sru01_09340 [Sphaerisporangium rufum]
MTSEPVSVLVDIVGMVGAGALLFAYVLLSMSKISGDGLVYQLINLGGAVALMVNSAYHFAWPSALLNLIWSTVGAFALWRLATARPWKRRVPDG